MITVNNKPLEATDIMSEYPENSVERTIIKILSSSQQTYNYDSINQLRFELRLRREIINASNALYRSKISFKVFRDSICNPDYWARMNDGGFALKAGVKPSDAIRDIYINSHLYGTECATAMLIIYYKAILEVFPEDAFNRLFPNIYLMNWHRIERELREVGLMHRAEDYLPADRRYFANPDVNPETPHWQGENVIDLDNGLYYGHGIGKYGADTFIKVLNNNRKEGAERSAYLMDSAGRPNFKRLSYLYDQAVAVASPPS
ncbi:MAG: protein-glutamine gamma-glutamyltransferase [Bacillota bacterium]|jgi:protein-glutamine gamma-glutamyltransferase